MRYWFLITLLISAVAFGQKEKPASTDSLDHPLKFRHTLAPLGLISIGLVGTYDPSWKKVNLRLKHEIWGDGHPKVRIDDYLQYAPGAAVFGLTAFGYKGKNTLLDQLFLLGGSYAIMGATVNTVKYTTKIQRPDGTTYNSFPSGHTATAFMMAEFLHQEYKHRSILFSFGGYALASGVAYLRMYNNRHWFSDVVCGAGVGMLSTKLFYYLYPRIKAKIGSNKSTTISSKINISPSIGIGQAGFVLSFNNSASPRQNTIFAENFR
ncbi:MAG: phosphatase PAP2 family protein [Crocinitomicaceae bacterium]|jgi:membrane-associated phospholipid phosphatase|nr:phosphatase PAP2 family protein [Crocinitomicaceae bacterium]